MCCATQTALAIAVWLRCLANTQELNSNWKKGCSIAQRAEKEVEHGQHPTSGVASLRLRAGAVLA